VCNGKLTLADVERQVIIATLRHYKGHRRHTANALGIGDRTLGYKLKSWKLAGLVEQEL
jgi:DNA-binding NtrC family response regulator